jgi:serine/threonine protein kinase
LQSQSVLVPDHPPNTVTVEAFGRVSECRLANRSGKFAVKVASAGSASARSQLRQELGFLERVHHENIVGLVAFANLGEDSIAIVMECFDGSLRGVLDERVRTVGDGFDDWFEGSEGIHWLSQLSAGISYLHTLDPSVAHRFGRRFPHIPPSC